MRRIRWGTGVLVLAGGLLLAVRGVVAASFVLGDLYISQERRGLHRVDPNTGIGTPFLENGTTQIDSSRLAFWGQALYVAFSNQVKAYDADGNVVATYSIPDTTVGVSDIAFDPGTGRLWLSRQAAGAPPIVQRLDLATGAVDTFTFQNAAGATLEVSTLAFRGPGDLYFAVLDKYADDGLYRVSVAGASPGALTADFITSDPSYTSDLRDMAFKGGGSPLMVGIQNVGYNSVWRLVYFNVDTRAVLAASGGNASQGWNSQNLAYANTVGFRPEPGGAQPVVAYTIGSVSSTTLYAYDADDTPTGSPVSTPLGGSVSPSSSYKVLGMAVYAGLGDLVVPEPGTVWWGRAALFLVVGLAVLARARRLAAW